MTQVIQKSGLGELLLWLLRRRRRMRVTGDSMYPVLADGDYVLVDLNAYRHRTLQPVDIIVIRHPYRTDMQLIKRVGSVLTDGRVQLHGDNPPESTDSRVFGPVRPEHILGQVTSRFS